MLSSFVRRTLSFRTKMVAAFFLITIIPFMLFAWYSYHKFVQGISDANAMFSLDNAEQSGKNLDQYLRNLNNQINEVIGNKKLQRLLDESGNRDNDAFILDMLDFVYVNRLNVDAFRIRIFPVRPDRYPGYMDAIGYAESPANQEWFQKSANSVTPTWHLFRSGENMNGTPLLAKFKRFTGLNDRNPRGIFETDLSDDQLRRYLSPSSRASGNRIYLLDQEGEVLFDSEGNEGRGLPISDKALLAVTKRSGSGAETIALNGAPHLITYVRLSEEPWLIVGTTPLKSLTGQISAVNRLLIVFVVVYVVSCVGVVCFLTVSFTNPVVRLVQYMRKLQAGQISIKLPPTSRNDEIGWLYRGFNSMSMEITRLIEEAFLSERAKKELEFQVLSHQINPHFLYNTLEAIRWKAEIHNKPDISEMVANLGNLLRLSLNGGREIATLGREIEQVKAYVSIEQARLGEPLRIMFLIDDELSQLPFLRLLLQPLVENAIHHGIRSNTTKGKIVLSGIREDNDIVLTLNDNGEGMSAETLRRCLDMSGKPSDKLRGVGVSNVNERLVLYFGEAYRLSITSSPGEGTTIVLRHPIQFYNNS